MSARREKEKRQRAKLRYERALWNWYRTEPPKNQFIRHWLWKQDKPKKEDA